MRQIVWAPFLVAAALERQARVKWYRVYLHDRDRSCPLDAFLTSSGPADATPASTT
jgi:hypothetical protein